MRTDRRGQSWRHGIPDLGVLRHVNSSSMRASSLPAVEHKLVGKRLDPGHLADRQCSRRCVVNVIVR